MTLYNLIARYYNDIFPLDSDRSDYISGRMKRGQQIYEAGCATGELAFSLAARGLTVHAVDLNEGMIQAAQERAGEDYPGLYFEARDMTVIPEDLSFHAACCFGNTLPHLKNRASVSGFFRSVSDHLADGGFFTFQIINFDSVLRGEFTGFPVKETDDFRFERAYSDINEESLVFTITLTDKATGSVMSDRVSLLTLTREWVEQALSEAGFTAVHCLADYRGTAAEGRETALLFDCVKRG